MPYQDYKDLQNHKPLFSLFHYESDWSKAGLRPEYFTKVPGEQFTEVVKSASAYLKTGNVSNPIIEFITFLYRDTFGARSLQKYDVDFKRIADEFKPENKDLSAMKDPLTHIINILKSWSSGTAASRLNLAVSVYKVCTYSSYSGSDFEKVYDMCIECIKKNKIKIYPNSFVEINKKNTHISKDTIDNSIGFSQIDIDRWNSVVTLKIDGKEYIAGSFDKEIGYGYY